MKRTDHEITDIFEIESILNDATVCRIGLADASEPYIIPVCFGYVPGSIYLHSSVSGKKIAMMGKNPKVCFEVDQYDTVIRSEVPCAWGMRYRSVIGFGRASLIADNNEKKQGLNCILSHYGGRLHEFSDDEVRSVCVIRIDIDSMTGKKHD
jgi:nitroimidazol reductase NimA-like FMN-containing flavoprotein (pyridoxamine 5'-phosphate oxidase superfamily)